jgi:hypothetical protein
MYIDKKLKLCDSQAVTVSAASSDSVDLGAAGKLGLLGLMVCITVIEAATAAGAATVQIGLQCDDASSFASAKDALLTRAIPKTELTLGKQIFIPLPPDLDEQHVRLYFTVATGPLTAGKFSAAIVEAADVYKAYPSVST